MNVHSLKSGTVSDLKTPEKPATPKAEDKRTRLLDAALELFETRGYDAVAVPEIARKAGVATGTVYLYFKDKDALVNTLYRHWKDRYNATVLAPLPKGASVRQAFSTYWQRMMLFARTFPNAVRFMDLHHHGDYLDDESREASRAYLQVAEAFVTEGRRTGALRDIQPTLAAALMWGAATGLVKFAANGAIKFDATTATEMQDAVWRAISNEPTSGGKHGSQAKR
jgi:AcrR family transcriptional regulator